MTFYDFLANMTLLSPIISAIGFVLGMYYYRFLDVVHKAAVWYLLAMTLVDIASRIMGASGNNIRGLLLYALLEMSMFTFFYFKYIFKARHRTVFGLFCIAFVYIVYEVISFDRDKMIDYQSYSKVIDDFMIIVLTLTFFHEKINIFKESKWDNFRMNAVVMVNFSINLVFFLPFNFIINRTSGYQFYFWLGITIMIILFYSYLTHSIWKNGRTQRLLLYGLR